MQRRISSESPPSHISHICEVLIIGSRSIAVKDDIVRAFNRYAAEGLKRCVWSKGCTAWYNKKNGESTIVTAMYPGSVLHYKGELWSKVVLLCTNKSEYIKTIRPEHFDIRYNTSNPFRYLGNGELEFERAEDGDLAYYLT